MKLLLMLLVLANLGFFAWQHWYGGEAPRARGEPRAGVAGKRLVLVGEQEGAAAPAMPSAGGTPLAVAESDEAAETSAIVEIPDEVQESAPLSCATLGPFEQVEAAEVARSRLAMMDIEAVLRESGGQIRAGFWVYLPPFPDRDAAEDIEDELRAKNVQDLFIVTGAEQRNAISLGLFSSPERADQRAAEIGRLGYTPRVAERFRDATVYWLDFAERPGEPLEPESVGVMASGETLPEKRPIPCADIAVGAGGA